MGKQQETTSLSAATPTMLTALDVQQKEFRVSRMGGYKMRDVDEFLDQITDTLTALTGEVERLRSGAVAPVVGSPDLDDVGRQADEIIARARAEAARITAEARAAGGVGANAGGQDRQAVSAFIERERTFLQSLAGLVQEHAETVKGMAKSARQAPAAGARQAPAAPAVTAASSTPPAAVTEATTSAAAAPRRPASSSADGSASEEPAPRAASEAPAPNAPPPPTDEPGSDAPTRVPDSEPTVRIDEPAPAGARSQGRRGDGDGEGDRSLRELFWGED